MCKTLLIIVGLAALLYFGPRGWALQPVGAISYLYGSAKVQRAPDTLPATLTMPIVLHDQLSTAPASTLTINLVGTNLLPKVCSGQRGEGCLLLLASSTMVIDQFTVETRVRLLAGSVRSGVARPPTGPTRNFFIQTANALMRAFGTDFDVTYTEGVARPGYGGCTRYTDVAVREGVVEVSNLANPAAVIEVPAGYETTVACLQPPLGAGPMGITGALSASSATGVRAPGTLTAVPVPPPSVVAPPPVPALVQ